MKSKFNKRTSGGILAYPMAERTILKKIQLKICLIQIITLILAKMNN